MSTQPITLRKVIRRLRDNLGLNQYQFSKLVGVSPNTVKNWETDAIRSLNVRTQHKLQKALNLTDEEILRYFFHGELPPVKERAPETKAAAS